LLYCPLIIVSAVDSASIYQDREKGLLSLIAEGDETAFFSFYKKYAPRIRAYAWKATRSETEAEEIVQESFIRVWLSRDKLPDVENVSASVHTYLRKLTLAN